MSLEYQIGQVVYSKSGHDQGDVQMICAIEGEYLLLADGRRRKLEKPKRKKKKHVQPTFYVEKDVAAKLQSGTHRHIIWNFQKNCRQGNIFWMQISRRH